MSEDASGKGHQSLADLPGLELHPSSWVLEHDVEMGITCSGEQRQLAVLLSPASLALPRFEGRVSDHRGARLIIAPMNARNAAVLRDLLPWLRPRPLGLRTSVGAGDRLGVATPGHIRAVRAAGGTLAPILAQQSIREMQRTGRSPQDVADDALWGVFGEGWSGGYGADADHLKTKDDIDACLAGGFSFFTFDPGIFVDDAAATRQGAALRAAVHALPWDMLADSPEALVERYSGRAVQLPGVVVSFDEGQILHCAVKYGAALAHVACLYRYLMQKAEGRPVEVEISVDETESPTTHQEHIYIATELRRLDVQWISLAPRFIGRFEKGVEYVGDLGDFEDDFAIHAAIARELGPYKLSLHSGSDKFSIYSVAARYTEGLIHLKTAGTSYLEALRTLAHTEPALFRRIYAFAREHYETDKASYHVSASLFRAPNSSALTDPELPSLLDEHDPRQILHVTFGSVLRARDEDGTVLFADGLMSALQRSSDLYASHLESHFLRHFRAFAATSKGIRRYGALEGTL